VKPIRVIVRRGEVVESSHLAHAVAVHVGAVVEQAGDAGRIAFLRSSTKPFQALPLVRARDDLTDEEIAIASASHLASPEQLAAVRSLLAKAPAGEDELECGPEPTALEHNCSGKHAGMLALCRAMGWASSMAERSERVRAKRLSGAHPVQAMDALDPRRLGIPTPTPRLRSMKSPASVFGKMSDHRRN